MSSFHLQVLRNPIRDGARISELFRHEKQSSFKTLPEFQNNILQVFRTSSLVTRLSELDQNRPELGQVLTVHACKTWEVLRRFTRTNQNQNRTRIKVNDSLSFMDPKTILRATPEVKTGAGPRIQTKKVNYW